MIDPASQAQLEEAIADCICLDQGVLDTLREEISPLRNTTRRIQPRATTSISLVWKNGDAMILFRKCISPLLCRSEP